MKIIHVVCFYSNKNPFGGPSAVAIDMVNYFSHKGCVAELRAGTHAFRPKDKIANSRLFRSYRLIPGKKFTGLVSIKLWLSIFSDDKRESIYHIHLGRDLNSMIFSFLLSLTRRSYLIQTHGMISPSEKRIVKIIDHIFISRIFQKSKRILYLTNIEREKIELFQNKNLNYFPNTIQINHDKKSLKIRKNILFVGRLHHDKNPTSFIEFANLVASDYPNLEFKIIGSEGGELQKVLELISQKAHPNVCYLGEKKRTEIEELLAETMIVIVPSKADVFPRIILEAVANECALIISEFCQVAPEFAKNEAATICSTDTASILEAAKKLIKNEKLRRKQIANASKHVDMNYNRKKWMELLQQEMYNLE